MPQVSRPSIVNFAAGLICAVIIGWLLMIGYGLIIPILLAVISVYLVTAGADALGRLIPVLEPRRDLRVLFVLIIFLSAILGFSLFLSENARAISAAIPKYSDNLNALIASFSQNSGMTEVPTVASLIERLQKQIDFSQIAQTAFTFVSGIGSVIVLAICYAAFLAADLKGMPRKLRLAFGTEEQARYHSLGGSD